jgi:glycosyltransferase involved in cell wall biosynthesis
LTVSRLSRGDWAKGVDEVISALPAIRSTVPKVQYTVVGDGDDVSRLRGEARRHGVEDLVRFVGSVSDAELHGYLARSDVFVMPSRQEGFGIVFLEAMAYGKPVVARAHGGAPEVVLDGTTGILIRGEGPRHLVAALTTLLGRPSMRAAMGAAASHRVRSLFSYERFRSSAFAALDGLLPPQPGLRSTQCIDR